MQVKKQHLEPDMEQWTGSKLGKEYIKTVYREDPPEKEMATHSILLPGEFHGQRNLVGYSPWGHKESDATE